MKYRPGIRWHIILGRWLDNSGENELDPNHVAAEILRLSLSYPYQLFCPEADVGIWYESTDPLNGKELRRWGDVKDTNKY